MGSHTAQQARQTAKVALLEPVQVVTVTSPDTCWRVGQLLWLPQPQQYGQNLRSCHLVWPSFEEGRGSSQYESTKFESSESHLELPPLKIRGKVRGHMELDCAFHTLASISHLLSRAVRQQIAVGSCRALRVASKSDGLRKELSTKLALQLCCHVHRSPHHCHW